jgi:hypothetical protein
MIASQQSKKSNIFGIIAAAIGVIALFTPKIMLTPVLVGLAIFVILGLAKDRQKIYSLFGLAVGVLILYLGFKDVAESVQSYQVEYKVSCIECDCSYTNATGGTDQVDEIRGVWTKQVTVQGDDFIHLSAQNADTKMPVTVYIKVNGILVEEETSEGRFAIANVSCFPKDVNR